MEIVATEIPAVKIIVLKKHGDARGFFSEIYSRKPFHEAGIDVDFVQDNHSLSATKYVVRGLHYQIAPKAQAIGLQNVGHGERRMENSECRIQNVEFLNRRSRRKGREAMET